MFTDSVENTVQPCYMGHQTGYSAPMMKLITRRAVLRMAALGTTCAVPYTYGATRGRSGLVVERSTCPLLPDHSQLDGLRVAVMSDFHFDETLDGGLVDEAVALSNAQDPHVVLLPGDFVSHDALAARQFAPHLKNLRARLGVFASTGNHDHWSNVNIITDTLRDNGVETLRNESRVLSYRGRDFAVVGLDSIWGAHPEPREATRDLPEKMPRILSMHEPDYFDIYPDMAQPRPILQVSGHTHGGQICAPFIGPLKLPRWGEKYAAGAFGDAGARLYVTRGIGTIGPPARIFCRPEVSVITLKA